MICDKWLFIQECLQEIKDDLQNQVAFLRQFCNAKGIIVDQCIEDYGSGLNYNRKEWNKLLDAVMEEKSKP